MISLKCPVCGEHLFLLKTLYRCKNGHSFDISREGYVNLLISNRAVHGDDKGMVRARNAFLEQGHYLPLRNALSDLACKYTSDHVTLLDAGGGEGWYTFGVKEALYTRDALCVDISKEALKIAAKRGGLTCAVASVTDLPVPDDSADLILNIFAPEADAEFSRVLKPGGVLLRVVPLEEHLMGLKAAVYDTPRPNPAPSYAPAGFSLLEQVEVRDTLTLNSTEDIQNLFSMTPYYYKTSVQDREKLSSLTTLTTELAFCIFVHKKD